MGTGHALKLLTVPVRELVENVTQKCALFVMLGIPKASPDSFGEVYLFVELKLQVVVI